MKTDTICGVQAVAALFACRPDDALRLFYTKAAREQAGPFCATMAAARKPYRLLEPEDMAKAAGTQHHAGLVAVAKARPVAILDPANPPLGKLLLVLDGIGNPHNLGAIARSAAFFGVKALLIGEGPGHTLPSDAAYRTAKGGLEYLDLYRSRDLPRVLRALDPHYRTVAATPGPRRRALGRPAARPSGGVGAGQRGERGFARGGRGLPPAGADRRRRAGAEPERGPGGGGAVGEPGRGNLSRFRLLDQRCGSAIRCHRRFA